MYSLTNFTHINTSHQCNCIYCKM